MLQARLSEHDGELETPMWVCRFAVGERGAWGHHFHRQHQIAWACHGVSTVLTEHGSWTATSGRAIWIPGGLAHDIVNEADTELLCLYIWPEHCPVHWPDPLELLVGPLTRELLLSLGETGTETPVSQAAATLLFHHFERGVRRAPSLPIPDDERAAELAREILAAPADRRTLDEWADQLATSASTLRRGFLAGTGLTYSAWRARARLDAALPLLDAGMSVGQAARRVGFSSRSGFVDAFRRQFGHAPGRYRPAATAAGD